MINRISSTAIKFVVVGATMTIVYFLLVFSFVRLGIAAIGSSLLAYAITVGIGYLAQSRWAFGQNRIHRRSLSRYFSTQLAGASLAVFAARASSFYGFSPLAISLAATIVAGLCSFLVTSLWVFPPTLKELSTDLERYTRL
jgi:putative flippase GtrA